MWQQPASPPEHVQCGQNVKNWQPAAAAASQIEQHSPAEAAWTPGGFRSFPP